MWEKVIELIMSVTPKRLFQTGIAVLGLTFVALVLVLILVIPVFIFYRIDPVVWVSGSLKAGQVGMIGFEKDLEELADDRKQLLTDSKKEAFYIGPIFARTLEGNTESIIDAVKRGVKVKILMSNLNGIYFDANATLYGGPDKFKERFQTFEGLYKEIKKRLEKDKSYLKGSFEVRQLDYAFHNILYFYDPSETDGRLIMMVPDFSLKKAAEMPAFYFLKTNSGAVERYYATAKELWERSHPYEK
jgi:hypothetical protein